MTGAWPLCRTLLGALVGVLWSSHALAADFQVNVVFQRPAIFREATGALRSRTPSTSDRIGWVPASYQLVEVYQSNWSGPQFCGAAYTNSAGQLATKFSCGANLPNDLQLVMRGDSARGFRVGYNSPYPHEQFDVAYAFHWPTPWLKAQATVIDFGVRRIGEPTNFTDPGFRAAALAEILDLLYQELNLGYIVYPPGSPSTALFSNWIVNDEASSILGLSAPWTYHRTVHMPAGSEAGYVLDAAAHELGHVLYNQAHSGWDHYSTEVFDYMKSHDTCQNYGAHFGSYEGFAHAVYDLAWRQHAERVGSTEYRDPAPSCSASSLGIEGNVNEFYTHAFAGIPLERPLGSIGQWTTRSLGVNRYAFPPTASLWELVKTAGMAQEDLSGLWTAAMSGFCAGGVSGVPKFCGSRRFKCLVRSKMLAATDAFPAEFKNVACSPGVSNVTLATLGADGKYTVTFGASDYADSYTLEVFDNGSTTPVSYPSVTSPSVGGVSLTACRASKMRVRTSLEGDSATRVGSDYPITPNRPEWKPPAVAITSAAAGSPISPGSSDVTYTLTHATAAGAKSYRVYVSTSAASNGTPGLLHTGGQTTAVLTRGTTYTLRVESQNDCGTTMGAAFTITPELALKSICTRMPDGSQICKPSPVLQPSRLR